MATWDDSNTSEADSELDDERASIALMANVTEDSEASQSDSESYMLQISLAAKQKHQSWYLDSGFSRHMTGRKHMFQSLELKPRGYVGFGGNQRGKIIGSGKIDIEVEFTGAEGNSSEVPNRDAPTTS